MRKFFVLPLMTAALAMLAGAAPAAAQETVDVSAEASEATTIWSYTFNDGTIDAGAYVWERGPRPGFAGDGEAAAVDSEMVVLGLSTGLNSAAGFYVRALALDASTGSVRWSQDFGGSSGCFVVSMETITDQTGDGKKDILMLYRIDNRTPSPVSPVSVNVVVLDSQNGFALSLTENNSLVAAAPTYFQPLAGDFDGDGRRDNLLIRKYNYTSPSQKFSTVEAVE